MFSDVMVLRHNHQVRRVVVVLVPVDVMHDLTTLKWSAKHLFSHNTMLVTSVSFAIGRFLDDIKPCKLRCTVIGSALLLRSDVMRITVAAHALRVHTTHAIAVY